MISDVHMKTGSWNLSLRPDAPVSLRQQLGFGTVICFTSGYSGALTAADAKARSLWSGLLTQRAVDAGEFSGTGLLGFLSTGKAQSGYIPQYGALPVAPFTFAQLMVNYFTAPAPATNGLRIGSAHSASAITVAQYDATSKPGLKTVLDSVCAITGDEYRVTPQGLVDYGVPGVAVADVRYQDPAPGLFKTRRVIVSPDFGSPGDSGQWWLVRPTSWEPDANIAGFRNSFVAWNLAETTTTNANASGAVTTFLRYDGTGPVIYNNDSKAVAPSNTAADILKLAQAGANLYAVPQYSIGCSVDIYCPTRLFVPGDWIYVYDPIEGLVGTTHVAIPGMQITPRPIRVLGMNWPIQNGMGVYAIDPANRTVARDLTPFVEWETGTTALTLGSPPVSGPGAAIASLIA